jgi:hypothetical protein
MGARAAPTLYGPGRPIRSRVGAALAAALPRAIVSPVSFANTVLKTLMGARPRDASQRKQHGEDAAGAGNAFDLHVTAMPLHNGGNNRKPKAGSTLVACTRGVHAIETIKNVGQIFLNNAYAGISNGYHRPGVFTMNVDGDPTTGAIIVDGIFHQVTEGTGEQRSIAMHHQLGFVVEL